MIQSHEAKGWPTLIMDCNAYLKRIGHSGNPRKDLTTLRQLQRAHLEHIPFENLDVQLGRRVTLSPEDAYTKLVTDGRGGWCYEMNGLFLWALVSIGFRATPMTAAMLRAQRGASAIGTHLTLRVELDQPYLVDVGLADSLEEPVPLREGLHELQRGLVRLERLDGDWWRFHNYPHAIASSFDFNLSQPADWNVLAEKCDWQQTSPDSRFVQNAICLRHLPSGVVALLGRVLKKKDQSGVGERLVGSADEYVDTLRLEFGLSLPQAASLWPKIVDRHEVLFGS
jgi:N-hydroxyarylamine O-acetyltransferase